MSLDSERIHGERYPRIAALIEAGAEAVAAEWLRRARTNLPVGVDSDTESDTEDALVRIQGFLHSLVRQLASSTPPGPMPRHRAIRLGELRWTQGENISQVVRDYQTLRLVLLDHLDEALQPSPTRDEWIALSLNIDDAIDASVSAYVDRETRLRDSYERELRESNRELQRFAHVVAHELKSPLNSQAMAIDLLKLQIGEEHLDEKALRTLSIATKSIEQMTDLINELLTYAEAEVEEAEVVCERTDSREVAAQAVENLKGEIVDSGSEIYLDRLPIVSAKPASLLLVFQNLIGNAINYRREEPLVVQVHASETEDDWLFHVSDNGSGIPPEDQARIFRMFARVHVDLRPRGTGIGLAMCRRVVERLGGRIWVESQPGIGSTFFFTLPKDGGVTAEAEDDTRAASA